MNVLHLSAECYPVAKVGGLADVVGALPKYLNSMGVKAAVVMPKYRTKWMVENEAAFTNIYSDFIALPNVLVPFEIQQLQDGKHPYSLYVVSIPRMFDREGVYADAQSGKPYKDEIERNICFQRAILQWLVNNEIKPDVIHCHDHHTGLIPFMMQHCNYYNSLATVPTIVSIHNGQYQGAFSWEKRYLLPEWNPHAWGLLDWNNTINSLACAIKSAWKVSTVSPGYMRELAESSAGLETLIRQEWNKCIGILNGIDTEVWNPKTDKHLTIKLGKNLEKFKAENKKQICERYGLHADLPLVSYIGRFAAEKGADMLAPLFHSFLQTNNKMSFFFLGSGDPSTRDQILSLKNQHIGFFETSIEYNEELARLLYAGSDFLIMPSRVEPCGLNQLYAFRYGTIPIVRAVGGLGDTVIDIEHIEGSGIRFNTFSLNEAMYSLHRAHELFYNKEKLMDVRKRITALDYSWTKSAQLYINVYNSLKPNL
jgi:starch synthase